MGMPLTARSKKASQKNQAQLSLFMDDDDEVIKDLRNTDILTLTPLETLNLISKRKDKLKMP